MCNNSKLSETSNFHEHDFSYTAEPNGADIAQLAKWTVKGTDDFEVITLSQTLIFFDIISPAQRTVISRRVFPDLRLLFSGVWSLSASRKKKTQENRTIPHSSGVEMADPSVITNKYREKASTKRNVRSVRKPVITKRCQGSWQCVTLYWTRCI